MNEIIIPALTDGHHRLMLCPPSQKTKDGRGNPNNSGVRTPYGVFLCPSFRQALSRALFIMAGGCGQAKAWPVPESGISTPLPPVAHAVESIGGGLSPPIQDKPMNTPNTGNHAQNPATTTQYGANGQGSAPSSNADSVTLNAQIEAPHVINDDNPELGVFPDEVWQRVASYFFAKIQSGEQAAPDNTEPTIIADESAPTDQPELTGNGYHLKQRQKITLNEMLARQQRERGLEPIPLEPELLLKRIKDGGHSGQYLADAFISAYRTDQPFPHSLGELIKLDAEAFRLFHEILHIRHVPGWNDDDLYRIEQRINAICKGGVQ